MHLTAKVIPCAALTPAQIASLYALYARHYDPTDPAVFARDLAAKSWTIVLTDAAGAVCGFSTVQARRLDGPQGEILVLYSGDTVVDRAHWGEQTLPRAWIEQAGRIKAQAPDLPLYWLLVSKGHRTYRYLPAFARAYHPAPDPDEGLHHLTDRIARALFGARYDEGQGVLLPDPACPTALRPAFRGQDRVRSGHPHAALFHRLNPHSDRGQELVCLCELSDATLRPRARGWFQRGQRE